MRTISIDPSSTVTGYAIFEDQGLVTWGKIDVTNVVYENRFGYIVGVLRRIADEYNIQEVAAEDVRVAWHGKNRNRNIAPLQVVYRSIELWAQRYDFSFTAYNPATWKSSVLGDHKATKDMTKANILLRFQNLPDDLSEHEYDAVGIGVYHTGLRYLEALEKK